MEKYINALKGISFHDWIKLRIAIDKQFDKQKSELEGTLKLTNPEAVSKIIHSQFG